MDILIRERQEKLSIRLAAADVAWHVGCLDDDARNYHEQESVYALLLCHACTYH